MREQLCELELLHKVITVARGSSKREKLVELAGKMQVPYLVDPNTGTSLFESADINAYLLRTYGPGAAAVPGTKFTCFTGTKVQILTLLLCCACGISRGRRWSCCRCAG